MAQSFLEVANIYHDYDGYSLDNVRTNIEEMRKNEETAEEAAKLQSLYKKYPEQLCALLRIKDLAAVDTDAGESLSMSFNEPEYIRPEVDTEKHDTVLPETQLELECTFEDGTRFGLSALPALPKSADENEPSLLKGQIRFSEDTLKSLNEEKFKRIVEFCERYGFSTFGLNVPTYGGEIDVDEKLADLLAKYQETRTLNVETKDIVKPSEDENSEEGFRKEDFIPLYDEETEEKAHDGEPALKKNMTLSDMVNTMRSFVEKDLQKRKNLSYWEHTRKIDGRRAYVFSIYDTENPKNWREDGRKQKDGSYKQTASFRLFVSQDKSGKFFFGYDTPNGSKMNDSIAGDFIGEIKKTGITHLNFSNIPNQDKVTWLVACAEKGIVPTGLSLKQEKVQMMLEKAQKKLSTAEYATFVERLMDQWEENAAQKGTPLEISEQEYIRKCRNDAVHKREDQYTLLKTAEFEKKFKNFRDAYDAADGLLPKVNGLIVSAGNNPRRGGATAVAAMNTLLRTLDIVYGLETDKTNALDVSLGERLDQLMNNPLKDEDVTLPRITDVERRALLPLAGKQIKDLTKEDYMKIYDLLYKRQLKQTERLIIDNIKDNLKTNTKVAPHLLTEQLAWNPANNAVKQMNEPLRRMKADLLTLPERHGGLPVSEFREIAERELEAEKAAKEAAKVAEPKAAEPKVGPKVPPTHGRE